VTECAASGFNNGAVLQAKKFPKRFVCCIGCYFLSFFLSFGGGGPHLEACGEFLDQGWNPCPLQWKHAILTTGPPGKPRVSFSCGRLKISLSPLSSPLSLFLSLPTLSLWYSSTSHPATNSSFSPPLLNSSPVTGLILLAAPQTMTVS